MGRLLGSRWGVAAAAAFQSMGGTRLVRAAANHWSVDPGLRLRRREAPPFLILIYHRVHPNPTPFMIDPVPSERFDRQMRHLTAAYRPLPLAELLQRSRERTVPPGAVAVTFDDGYADNADHALPILERHGIPATVFLVTGCIGTGRIPWHDEVLLAFAGSSRRGIRLPGSPSGAPVLPLQTEEERRRAAFFALGELKPLPEGDRLTRVRAIQEELGSGDAGTARSLMLDWDRVRAMRRAGVRFGSHTVTHPILSRVTPEREREELIGSKLTLERELGEEISFFAYPNGRPGDFGERTVATLRAAGYGAAVTTVFGVNEAGEDPLLWRRASTWAPDSHRFALQIASCRLRGIDPSRPAEPLAIQGPHGQTDG